MSFAQFACARAPQDAAVLTGRLRDRLFYNEGFIQPEEFALWLS